MSDTNTHSPIGIDADSRPAFMYDDDLAVDMDDPIYRQVVEGMKLLGADVAPPAEQPRPDEMTVGPNGELIVVPTPPVADGIQVPAPDNGAPSSPSPSPAGHGVPAGEPQQPAQQPAAEPPAPEPRSEFIDVDVNGQTHRLDQAAVDYLLKQNEWMQQLPDTLKQQWAGVQDGTLVAIPREELARLQAAPPAAAPTPAPAPDLTYVDEDVREYITRLQATQQAPQPTPQQQASYDQGPSAFEMQQAARDEAERSVRLRGEIQQATTDFAADYSLTPEQAQRLQQVTVNLGVVPTLSRQRAVYSPMGQIIAEAPMADVMKQAYEIAMNTDPELKQLRDERVFNERLAAQNTATQATNQKKALAGSLAAAPSAAVPASGSIPQIGPGNQMDFNGTSQAIAAALAEAMKQGA